MENFLASTIGDFISQNIFSLVGIVVVVLLGITGFFGWRYREMKADNRKMKADIEMLKAQNKTPIFHQQFIINQNGNIKTTINESDNVIGKQDGNCVTFGTVHGPITVRLAGGQETAFDLVKWLHEKELIAPLEID